MIGFKFAITRLKRWLGKKQPEHVQVRTYAGEFEWPQAASSGCDSFDDLVKYAEANPNLRCIASDHVHIKSGKPIADDTGAFHPQIRALSLGWARYVVALRNRMM